jgi:hypothetical protein
MTKDDFLIEIACGVVLGLKAAQDHLRGQHRKGSLLTQIRADERR